MSGKLNTVPVFLWVILLSTNVNCDRRYLYGKSPFRRVAHINIGAKSRLHLGNVIYGSRNVDPRTPKFVKLAGPNVCGKTCCGGWQTSTSGYCTIPICEPKCRNRGLCIKPMTCKCQVGYIGSLCSYKTRRTGLPSTLIVRTKRQHSIRYSHRISVPPTRVLTSPRLSNRVLCRGVTCYNGGVCIAGECVCTLSYTGSKCQFRTSRTHSPTVPVRPRVSTTFSLRTCRVLCDHGTCTSTRCICDHEYSGTYCNTHTPRLSVKAPVSPTHRSRQTIYQLPTSDTVPLAKTYFASTTTLGKCYKEFNGIQCGMKLSGLMTATLCCRRFGDAWGTLCTSCSQITGKPRTRPVVDCARGFATVNGNCEDINECARLSESICRHGICHNSLGSYWCQCNSGYRHQSTNTQCVPAEPTFDSCHLSVNSNGVCEEQSTIKGSRAACCCSIGVAWGRNCQPCPIIGSREHKNLCPFGSGYFKVPTRATTQAPENRTSYVSQAQTAKTHTKSNASIALTTQAANLHSATTGIGDTYPFSTTSFSRITDGNILRTTKNSLWISERNSPSNTVEATTETLQPEETAIHVLKNIQNTFQTNAPKRPTTVPAATSEGHLQTTAFRKSPHASFGVSEKGLFLLTKKSLIPTISNTASTKQVPIKKYNRKPSTSRISDYDVTVAVTSNPPGHDFEKSSVKSVTSSTRAKMKAAHSSTLATRTTKMNLLTRKAITLNEGWLKHKYFVTTPNPTSAFPTTRVISPDVVKPTALTSNSISGFTPTRKDINEAVLIQDPSVEKSVDTLAPKLDKSTTRAVLNTPVYSIVRTNNGPVYHSQSTNAIKSMLEKPLTRSSTIKITTGKNVHITINDQQASVTVETTAPASTRDQHSTDNIYLQTTKPVRRTTTTTTTTTSRKPVSRNTPESGAKTAKNNDNTRPPKTSDAFPRFAGEYYGSDIGFEDSFIEKINPLITKEEEDSWDALYAFVPKPQYARVGGFGGGLLQFPVSEAPPVIQRSPSVMTSRAGKIFSAASISSQPPPIEQSPEDEGTNEYIADNTIGVYDYDEDMDACNPTPCVNDGFCVLMADGEFSCECDRGFIGELCEAVDWCVSRPCENDGVCETTEDSYICTCHHPYSGPNCEIDLLLCTNNSCVHGRCQNFRGKFRCLCEAGYTGPMCEADVDECEVNRYACDRSSPCVNTIGSYRCLKDLHCNVGFAANADATDCLDMDECLDNSTRCVGGSCTNTVGSFVCVCTLGYAATADGTECNDLDECETVTCAGGSVCRNIPGSYKCECPTEGVYYDYLTQRCVATATASDNDEDPRSDNGGSTPREARRSCFADHTTCRVELSMNVTERECCCTFGRAWGECGSCPFVRTASFEFMCPHGHGLIPALDSFRVKDIDECSLFGHSAACPNGRCHNSYGSFECLCYRGFYYNQRIHACQDFDECTLPYKCVDGTCINTIGSFHCRCAAGTFPRLVAMGITCVQPGTPIFSSTTPTPTRRTALATTTARRQNLPRRNLQPCFTVMPSSICDGEFDRNATYHDCCCSGGDSWGHSCSKCPTRDSNDFNFLCRQSSREQQHAQVDTQGGTGPTCGIEGGCANGICIRLNTGYTCECNRGYRLNTHTMRCDDINECLQHNARFQLCIGGRCVNTQGSFRCNCRHGYKPSPINPSICVSADQDYVNDRPNF